MKKLDSILLKVFLYGLPAVIVMGAFSYYNHETLQHATVGCFRYLNNLTGLSFALWMFLSIYLSIRLILSPVFREKVLAKITFIRERDEREAILTGKATKTTFLTSLAILIFLFFLSCFQISIYTVPPENAVNGKTGFVTLGVGFKLLENGRQTVPEAVIKKTEILSYTGLHVSSTSIILLLIVWQIVSYNCSIRRLMK